MKCLPNKRRAHIAAQPLHYNRGVKTWDVVIVGAGVIGLSLAWRLRREGLRVLILEKGEPAREASHAAGGMIAHCDPHLPPPLRAMACASAAMFREFVHELQDESGESPDLRDHGAIAFLAGDESPTCEGARSLCEEEVGALEPSLGQSGSAYFLPESSVDPRALCSRACKGGKTSWR